jgi:hypothetical protein
MGAGFNELRKHARYIRAASQAKDMDERTAAKRPDFFVLKSYKL